MKTLGVDQSYTSTGWCLNDNGAITSFGTIRTEGDDMYKRAAVVANTIASIVKEHKVDRVVMEGLAFGGIGNATRNLAGLIFVIVTTLDRECPTVDYSMVAPTSLKKTATGSGKATKKEMIASVPNDVVTQFKNKNFRVTTGLADLCDSYWLSVFHGVK